MGKQDIGKSTTTLSWEREQLKNTSTAGIPSEKLGDRLRRDRKYKAFWAVFLMASSALFWDKLSGAEFVQLVTFVFGLYMAGNGFVHWANKDN
jgi:hypothetical protein